MSDNRCLLHKTKLEEFKAWLDSKGIQHRPGKGDWQVLQVQTTNFGWQVVFEKKDMPEHFTVNDKLVSVVREFINSSPASRTSTPSLHSQQEATERIIYAHQASAHPAPSVPTALLVAVANLVAQMEIVSRVGFVDTPNDKDSCAAFCVAEGTWLELMSAVESLALALAAAPEAKP